MLGRIKKKTTVVFLVLILLTAIITGAVTLSLMKCAGSLRRSYHTIVLGDKSYVEGRFRVDGHGTSVLSNGRLAGFTTLRSSDCVNVVVLAEDRGSPEQAKEEMEKRIREASKVVERVSLFDPHGEPIGQRAILVFQREPRVEIIAQHNNNASLLVIGSPSLAHALAYENLIQNGYRVDRDGYFVAQSKQPGGQ
jgi:hypothetical protein